VRLLVQAQGVLAAGGVFGQQDVGVGTVGADCQSVLGKPGAALFIWLLECLVHQCLGFTERRILVGIALQRMDELLHHPFHCSTIRKVGEGFWS
jgi:hypothetical protein